jgi:hypothetical protein
LKIVLQDKLSDNPIVGITPFCIRRNRSSHQRWRSDYPSGLCMSWGRKITRRVTDDWQTTVSPERNRSRDLNETWHVTWHLWLYHPCYFWFYQGCISFSWLELTLSHWLAIWPIEHFFQLIIQEILPV